MQDLRLQDTHRCWSLAQKRLRATYQFFLIRQILSVHWPTSQSDRCRWWPMENKAVEHHKMTAGMMISGAIFFAQPFHELMSKQQLWKCFQTARKKGADEDVRSKGRGKHLGNTLLVTQTRELDTKLYILGASNNGMITMKKNKGN